MRPSGPAPPGSGRRLSGHRPVGIRQGGCLLHERTLSLKGFPPLGFFLPWVSFPPLGFFSPDRFPPLCPALGSRVRRPVYKLATHHAKYPYGSVLLKARRLLRRGMDLRCNRIFIASFLRYLHCGRYPWLWNDEHVLVLLAVV